MICTNCFEENKKSAEICVACGRRLGDDIFPELHPSINKQGKQAVGLVVTDSASNRLSFGRATGRYFAKFISGLTLSIGYIMAGFTNKKQALHDMMADTLVIKKARY